jgi:hypothetical protein
VGYLIVIRLNQKQLRTMERKSGFYYNNNDNSDIWGYSDYDGGLVEWLLSIIYQKTVILNIGY